MSEHTSSDEGKARMNRRSLLRRGGAVMAGVAAAQALNAPSAQATIGTMQFGTLANNADVDVTGLTSTSPATLQLTNTGNGTPLRLANRALPAQYFRNTAIGDLAVHGDTQFGSLLFTHAPSPAPATQDAFVAEVYTEFTASQLVLFTTPIRAVDTRNPAFRSRITNPSVLDSTGRLRANATAIVNTDEFAIFSTALVGVISAVTPTASGYLTVWGAGARPGTASLTYTKGVTIANLLFTAVDSPPTGEFVRVFTPTATHFILDITGFFVGSPAQVNPDFLPTIATASKAAGGRQAKRTLPGWYRGAR